MGLDELIGWFHIAENLGHENIMNSLRLFAEKVKPQFADRPGKLPRALEEVRT
jgi:hypothetical protein